MSLNLVPAGNKLPHEFNVIIEIPAQSDPVKYEVDKDTGAIFVDRFMGTAMHYPCNYGYIPNTLSEDGDPIDVLVRTPIRVIPGSVVRCRALGVLDMEDESGIDYKVMALPVNKLTPFWSHVSTLQDMPPVLIKQIEHFFEHYKDLEEGKWVKVQGWRDKQAAEDAIMRAVEAFNKAKG
jgi:inorganic pyrophosphatase